MLGGKMRHEEDQIPNSSHLAIIGIPRPILQVTAGSVGDVRDNVVKISGIDSQIAE
jgi:hypothetical protein